MAQRRFEPNASRAQTTSGGRKAGGAKYIRPTQPRAVGSKVPALNPLREPTQVRKSDVKVVKRLVK